MTRASIYEKREGKKDIKKNEYFLSDYVRIYMLRNLLCVTIAYLLILALYAVNHVESIFEQIAAMQIGLLIREMVVIYVILIVIYAGISIIAYAWQYQTSHERIKKYYRMLKLIDKYGQEDKK